MLVIVSRLNPNAIHVDQLLEFAIGCSTLLLALFRDVELFHFCNFAVLIEITRSIGVPNAENPIDHAARP